MAQISRYTVRTPPEAPEREGTSHLLLKAYAAFVIFSAFAHSMWWNLIGGAGAVGVLVLTTAATLAIWIPRLRRVGLPWRRLPWLALAYTAWALVSVLWSGWPGATLITWLLLAAGTLQGVFLAHVLTWHELLRALDIALKWVIGLSVAIELWVALILRAPLLPNFVSPPDGFDPQWYWVRGQLFDALIGDRIQGIVGNANYLGILCVLAFAVFAVRLATHPPHAAMQIVWIAATAVLFVRSGSATALGAFAAAFVVLLAVLVMRRARTPGERSRRYLLFAGVAAVGAVLVMQLWDRVLGMLGRDDSLTGRDEIWSTVWGRAITHPVHGNGFASPWVPWDPAFDGWIVDHGLSVFHAHNMWLDVFFQLGGIGVLLMFGVYAALVWRSWFFAIDRPRWDLDANRPYSPVSILAPLAAAMLLAQGLTESGPIMLWGWTLAVALSFKIKLAPFVGVGADAPALGNAAR
ncbi:O-antigen ligase family protein [Microbacterium marinilacus]|uniref:O-antigen ligase-related domain-containing protein n=1 Tax=Microbacterium marinilacus TaxID=415209 RepID=A0ABP7BAK2_9MICO|nr:O-antigen ligase family protein [Microbacterium marinilacus]MBY0687213.1 O-antigen ligase family protein [Microbacterium marinilacus]